MLDLCPCLPQRQKDKKNLCILNSDREAGIWGQWHTGDTKVMQDVQLQHWILRGQPQTLTNRGSSSVKMFSASTTQPAAARPPAGGQAASCRWSCEVASFCQTLPAVPKRPFILSMLPQRMALNFSQCLKKKTAISSYCTSTLILLQVGSITFCRFPLLTLRLYSSRCPRPTTVSVLNGKLNGDCITPHLSSFLCGFYSSEEEEVIGDS